MPAIGYVTREGHGFKGQLKTLSIRTEIEIVPNTRKTGDTQPDYRVSAGGVEVGAGWVRRGEMSGKDYVSLSLAAPEFGPRRSEEHTSELQSLMRISYAVFCLKKKNKVTILSTMITYKYQTVTTHKNSIKT